MDPGTSISLYLQSRPEPAGFTALPGRQCLPLCTRQGAHGEGNCATVSAVDDSNTYVKLEDVVTNNLDLLFPGMEITSCELFRVTRNAVVESEEEEADDLLAMIETELRDRHFAPIVRLQVEKDMNPDPQGHAGRRTGARRGGRCIRG